MADAKEFGWRAWRDDAAAAVHFLTRLPRFGFRHGAFSLDRGARVLPLAGAAIGGAIGSCYWLLRVANIPAWGAASMALAAGAMLTGGLHEDGLADTADGFGGGATRARKLEIMDDSRIGTYGVLALVFVIGLKIGVLSGLSGSGGWIALVAAHAIARTALPCVALGLPCARADGLAASAGRPSVANTAVAGLFGVVIAALTLPVVVAAIVIAVTGALVLAMRFLTQRQIGGYTGDVLGATEQLAEAIVLLVVATLH
jgi:adenosylcobinamide-GDP ribazoletransferase